ncbi:DUF3830 family protein [Halalkalibacillus halophilus]|uniref:DUF3830 family protein n=1 Tax=Halalkalibacillus halophilus TaxID=392827 RepID=UPI00040E3105|nr:DUF3830 family protein [Halalkalibacillus halophilus]
MNYFIIEFPESNESIRFDLLTEKAPKTCEAFWEVISEPVEMMVKHAIYTGKEISAQLPPDGKAKDLLYDPKPENLTCFPLPGDILFTFMPEYGFGGAPVPIFDIGVFYGRDARTFFPMGWLPGHLMAQVHSKQELDRLQEVGQSIHVNGQQPMVIRRGE